MKTSIDVESSVSTVTCVKCGTEYGQNYNIYEKSLTTAECAGVVRPYGIECGYGSKYDGDLLVWTGRPEKMRMHSSVCDSCITDFMVKERMIVYRSSTHPTDVLSWEEKNTLRHSGARYCLNNISKGPINITKTAAMLMKQGPVQEFNEGMAIVAALAMTMDVESISQDVVDHAISVWEKK